MEELTIKTIVFFSYPKVLSHSLSPVGDMFRCGEFPRSVLLLLRRKLFRFLVSLRDSEPIVM
jgi:hypothetical protein